MAKDPRTMTPKGRPGSGAASGTNQVTKAAKKKKQANGSNPIGSNGRKPPMNTRSKGAARTRGGTKSSKSSSDQVPGKTNYSYGGKK